jgi:hypothetical protein
MKATNQREDQTMKSRPTNLLTNSLGEIKMNEADRINEAMIESLKLDLEKYELLRKGLRGDQVSQANAQVAIEIKRTLRRLTQEVA